MAGRDYDFASQPTFGSTENSLALLKGSVHAVRLASVNRI